MAIIGTDIDKAKTLLQQGEAVGIPTETVYGLAANAFDPLAVAKIFAIKNRPVFDPLIVHVASYQQALTVADFSPVAQRLAHAFWPGPLTLVLPKKAMVPDLVTSGLTTVGVRSPRHPMALALLQALPFPLAAPSANPFGYVSPTTAQHVHDQLGDKLSYILDGGPSAVGVESTIVGFEGGETVIYRVGGVSVEALEQEIGGVRLALHASSNPKAPGQLLSHYAPRKRVTLQSLSSFTSEQLSRMGALVFRLPAEGIPLKNQVVLSPAGDLAEAAQNLFSALRKFDGLDVSLVWAEAVPEEGLGRAINDRLRRAAHPA
ncbi:MAG: L-threonylcarbamoyladenylate synthase [Cyclobacteriaceae bacterium]|jgi:L-threonylcarbamoyladenylate synthase|nr:L-threonylcarbamoyladenylate synthase [Cyclobacteriaceae bacterium]